ncbi:Pre-mRNA-splicing factor CEF1 [Nosema bombycis CQ1]|uniref:Pre-mRNA-splicing factor CEF1 n=1 Tax=Nosema bombycis (strain CQ1 / CVCC 102059) TaxID=578461 RepID=R0M0H5_NOSB1|nr:Pre-mRNA-splicing factor CEF1 [Nosema bombycis CQ1]|eukprot:EOB11524.1 Pre-mRNA-splicing factor CEF1 [Nosema bombycis CQ1]
MAAYKTVLPKIITCCIYESTLLILSLFNPPPLMLIEKEDNKWKCNEDKIIKLGVMKYGFNKWNKICSLLVNRTPLECKERWFNYLDPEINKDDWSLEECNKLIEVAACLKPQWRLIGTILGRNDQDCYEKYNKLVYKAIKVVKYPELVEPEGNVADEIYKSAVHRISINKSRKLKKKKAKKNMKK